jgi:hypothetical protein
VIDGDVEVAQRYAEANRVPYLVLADPKRVLISRFGAENGAYVALVTPAGILDTLWPGCSAEMMLELSRRAAQLRPAARSRLQPAATGASATPRPVGRAVP